MIAIFITQDEIDEVFFVKLLSFSSKLSVEETLSSSILILSRCNNVWCVHICLTNSARYLKNTPSHNVQIVNSWNKVVRFSFFSSILESLNLLHWNKEWLSEQAGHAEKTLITYYIGRSDRRVGGFFGHCWLSTGCCCYLFFEKFSKYNPYF